MVRASVGHQRSLGAGPPTRQSPEMPHGRRIEAGASLLLIVLCLVIKRVCAGQARGSPDKKPDYATNQSDGCKGQYYPQIDQCNTGPSRHVVGDMLSCNIGFSL
jgi:hypothetical protein